MDMFEMIVNFFKKKSGKKIMIFLPIISFGLLIALCLVLLLTTIMPFGSLNDMAVDLNDPDGMYDTTRDPTKENFIKIYRVIWGNSSPLNDHEKKYFDKLEKLVDDYDKKVSGKSEYGYQKSSIPFQWILTTTFVNYQATPTTPSNGDDYDWGDVEILPDDIPDQIAPNPEDLPCIELPDLPDLSDDERVASMVFDKNDNCKYNEKGGTSKLYWKDFSMGYEGMPSAKADPEIGTSKKDHSFLDSYVEEDLLRGLFNQMISKGYNCQFNDYHFEGEEKVIDYSPVGFGTHRDGNYISFPTSDNMYQVGYYKDACQYFLETEQPPLHPKSTHREIADSSSYYFVDLPKYIKYLEESDFFKKRFPKEYLGLNQGEALSKNKELVEEIRKILDLYAKNDEVTGYNPLPPGSSGSGGQSSLSPFIPEFKKPILTGSVSSCYGPRDYGDGSFHEAIDMPAATGTPLYSLGNGSIVEVKQNFRDGIDYDADCVNADGSLNNFIRNGANRIVIRYDPITIDGVVYNLTASYWHIQQNSVSSNSLSVGSKVVAGQKIAGVGHNGCSTGSHLHLEIRDTNTKESFNPHKILGIPCRPS